MLGQSYKYVLVILNVYLIIKYFLCIDQAFGPDHAKTAC